MGRDSCLAMVPASPAPEKAIAAANPTKPATPAALAPGFRFHPTDEELVSYYLKRKILNRPVRFNCISVVDIYKHEPWNLYDKSRLKTRDQEWYFFSILDKKYGNGARMNRATSQGYWKATGKDREVRHESKLIGMKKTLVFHSGRAPDGQRTNWVMHEYRLVEDEIERIGALQVYVLCRVFHKNNIGPPNGNRYAPFIEEEWDDDKATLIPGEDGVDELVAGDDTLGSGDNDTENNGAEKNEHEQEIQFLDLAPTNNNEQRKETALPCKIERSDGPELCVLNREASLPLLQYKRRRQNDSVFNNNDPGSNHANFPDNSIGANVQRTDHCSSTTTTAATTTTPASALTTAVSALLEFSSMESVEPRQQPPAAAPKPNAPTRSETPVPPTCSKLINELHNEIHKISVERETLRIEMMSAQAMINLLQSRIDYLNKENEDLKRRL